MGLPRRKYQGTAKHAGPLDSEKINSNQIMRPATHLDRKHNAVQSTYSYANHSYLRLKQLEISYKFPKKLLKPLSITACSFMSRETTYDILRSG